MYSQDIHEEDVGFIDEVREDWQEQEGEVEEEVREMRTPAVRQVYLITYSQADLEKVPTRRSFVDAVLHSFSGCLAEVLQWCCCMEMHADGGTHYHMCLKFDRLQRWISSKRRLLDNGMSVHFSDEHNNYYSAWRYVTKEDSAALYSPNHPDLSSSSSTRTNLASRAVHQRRRNGSSSSSSNESRRRREVEFVNLRVAQEECPRLNCRKS